MACPFSSSRGWLDGAAIEPVLQVFVGSSRSYKKAIMAVSRCQASAIAANESRRLAAAVFAATTVFAGKKFADAERQTASVTLLSRASRD